MYELSKPKTRGYWIILGIIIFAFITAVLRMALREEPSSFNDDMMKVANEMNSHAPIFIDSTTRLDNVNYLVGNILKYNYTLVSASKSDYDSLTFSKESRAIMIEHMTNNPKKNVFQENKIILRVAYSDSSGASMGYVDILPGEY